MKNTKSLWGLAALLSAIIALVLTGCPSDGGDDSTVNKAALTTAISAANTAKNGVVTDTVAANVPVGTQWVTQAVLDTFNTAIASAETVKNNASATQSTVNDAVTALNSAVSTFNTAKKDGTKTTGTEAADKAALTTAISAANTAKDGVVTDTAAANVPVGTKWVTQAEMTALTDAISTAQTVADDTAATQTAVDTATTALTTATSAFNTAKKDGTATDGTASLNLTFWVNESDGTFSVSSGSVSIAQDSDSFTATVATAYTSVQWYVDGAPVPSATTAAITIDGLDYDIGKHRLGVTVTKSGVYYSKEITFTVTE